MVWELNRREFGLSVAGAARYRGLSLGAETKRIRSVTRNPARLQSPPSTPSGMTWRYGVAPTFQVGPRLAGMFCNIRMEYAPGTDFEVGSDVILFDDLTKLGSAEPLPVSRNHEEVNPNSGPPPENSVMVKYWIRGGFVPLGAKREDGAPHPHSGTGFGLLQAISWPLYDNHPEETPGLRSRRAYRGEASHQYLELQQYGFDGGRFRVVSTERFSYRDLLAGWSLSNPAMRNAIPEGDDLLLSISGNDARLGASPASYSLACGVSRWRRGRQGWRPVSFVRVTDHGGWFEPSLIRDLDGSMLFSARGITEATMNGISVWQSRDGGATWKQIIDLPGVISQAPISLNQATDGTPYVAANPYEVLLYPMAAIFKPRTDSSGRPRLGGWLRENLCLWPLTPDRTGLEPPLKARECRAEFGPPPHGSTWRADHPTGMTLRLADGQWHHILSMRILESAELWGFGPTPHTGLYAEEVFSSGEPVPPWRF